MEKTAQIKIVTILSVLLTWTPSLRLLATTAQDMEPAMARGTAAVMMDIQALTAL
jgi:hypothetical protein